MSDKESDTKREQNSLGDDSPSQKSFSAEDESESWSAHTLAVSLLDSSSGPLRGAVCASLGSIVQDLEGEPTSSSISKEDLQAVEKLLSSSNPALRACACDWLRTNVDSLPRGQLVTGKVLRRTTRILETGMRENNGKTIEFALSVAHSIAMEGEIWARRLVETERWDSYLAQLLSSKLEHEQLVHSVLSLCSVLSRYCDSSFFLEGCVQAFSRYPQNSHLLKAACETLASTPEPISNETAVRLLLEVLYQAQRESNFALVVAALRALTPRNMAQAKIITQLFEEHEMMPSLNSLYRSQEYGSKFECARFLESLVMQLGDDLASLVLLCENGLIIRLIRLAAPSGATNQDGDELAYAPAINALEKLAEFDRIGARIVLSGGLGALFSHANSNRSTRQTAKRALNSLGVTNLGSVVQAWVSMFKASSSANSVEEPLERITLYDGSKLLWNQPPPQFFSHVVKDTSSVLGKGAFSVVHLATLENGQQVAVKRLSKAAAADPGFAEEIRVLARVPAHVNIVGLLGVYIDAEECLIISELGGPTLSSVLRSKDLEWRTKLYVLIDVADGIRHLHGLDPSILHLDVKASNILLVGNSLRAKICDFGLAVELKKGFEFLLPKNHGTIQWMAPEVIGLDDAPELGRGFDAGSDVFSFALTMWEVAHPGRVPWQNEDQVLGEQVDITEAIRNAVMNGNRPSCTGTDDWPSGFHNLMVACWQQRSSDRPRFLPNFLDAFEDKNKSRQDQTIGFILRKMLLQKN